MSVHNIIFELIIKDIIENDFLNAINLAKVCQNFYQLINQHSDTPLKKYILQQRMKSISSLKLSAIYGYIDLVKFLIKDLRNSEYFMSKYFMQEGLCGAILNKNEKNYREIIDLFIESCDLNIDWNEPMKCAATVNRMNLIKLFIDKGANDWNKGLDGAATSGDKDLINFFIKKGANDWNAGMIGSTVSGNKELINFFVKKGANNWRAGLYKAAEIGNKEFVDLYLELIQSNSQSIDNFEDIIFNAIRYNQINIIEYLMNIGLTNINNIKEDYFTSYDGNIIKRKKNIFKPTWNDVMCRAIDNNRRKIINLAIENGANDWKQATIYAHGGPLFGHFLTLAKEDQRLRGESGCLSLN